MKDDFIWQFVLNCCVTIVSAICAFVAWRAKRNIADASAKESSLRNSAVGSSIKKDGVIYGQMITASKNLWHAIAEQDNYIGPLNIVSLFKFENSAKLALENEKFRMLLSKFNAELTSFDAFSKSEVCMSAEQARLFVPTVAYNIYTCRMKLLGLGYIRLNAMQTGLDARMMGDDNKILDELCGFLPGVSDKLKKLQHHSYAVAFDMLKTLALSALKDALYINTTPEQVLNTVALFDKLYQEKQEQAKANGYC